MALRTVLKMGCPSLYEVAKPVEKFNTPFLQTLIQDMFETMTHKNGVGLAAPQIGVSLRIIIFGVEKNARYPNAEEIPNTLLINPKVEVLDSEKVADWEGCLSVPGMRGLVERPSKICYQGYDELGRPMTRTVSGFHARVVLHEVDHIDGILYPLRLKDLRQFGFEEVLSTRNSL
ncbi:MAG: peptide deformylase [Gammaproteobacteria bacterium]|nr:peptide deformylase [Gammaproteobacteria bacterium]